jgi:hypothetical protein
MNGEDSEGNGSGVIGLLSTKFPGELRKTAKISVRIAGVPHFTSRPTVWYRTYNMRRQAEDCQ